MRGKKTSPEDVYKIMSLWAITGNYAETSRKLGLPPATVKHIVEENKGKPEFVEVCAEKKDEFSRKATEIINKGLTLLDKRFGRAIESEEELDKLVDEIEKGELSPSEKEKIANKIRTIQLYDIKAITTAIGTLYDKRSLSDGESTYNVSLNIKLPE